MAIRQALLARLHRQAAQIPVREGAKRRLANPHYRNRSHLNHKLTTKRLTRG